MYNLVICEKPSQANAYAAVLGAKQRNVSEGTKGFFCENRDCEFKLWKNSKFWTAKKKPLTAAIVKALLKDGRVAVKGLHSEKTGKKYNAIVLLDDSGKFVNFKMDFGK